MYEAGEINIHPATSTLQLCHPL